MADLISGYNIKEKLGIGARSQIYQVTKPDSEELFTLKRVVRDENEDTRFLDQAITEFEVSSKFNHPTLRKSIELKRFRKWMKLAEVHVIMEYVAGVTLEKRRPERMEDAIDLFIKLAEGLDVIHQAGYVHADIKPNNIILTDNGPKIIDFGQSCPIGFIKPRIQGTPDYIAPEQVHRRPITPKTDIYNLGATMYAICTGQNVPTALAKGDKLVGSLDDNLIEKPKAAIELNPKINPKLNELIMQCVEVNPDKRPASMHAVADRLNLIHALSIAENNRKTGEFRPLDSQAD